jgi:hypothetical protein
LLSDHPNGAIPKPHEYSSNSMRGVSQVRRIGDLHFHNTLHEAPEPKARKAVLTTAKPVYPEALY